MSVQQRKRKWCGIALRRRAGVLESRKSNGYAGHKMPGPTELLSRKQTAKREPKWEVMDNFSWLGARRDLARTRTPCSQDI